MARQTSKGKCSFCNGEFGKAGMTKHLQTCKQRAAILAASGRGKSARIFHLMVDGRHAPEYWMHLELPADTSLTTLDSFLRDTWLECCGHLSSFDIGGDTYMSSVDRSSGFGERSMRGVRLGKVVSPGDWFIHEYDFGTTTELRLKVVGERQGQAGSDSVEVLARTDPPQIPCDECGEEAEYVCSQCVWDGAGSLCETHAEDHECDEDMLLPVVNSPRVGMCGYEG